MNKIYKVIWSNVRKCYVVVAEIAKNHGKNNVRSIVECLAAHALRITKEQWVMPVVAAGLILLPMSGWAATEIKPASVLPANMKGTIDANGNLVGSNGVYNVYMQRKIANGPGVNQFDKFSLASGNIANMHFKTKSGDLKADSLVNLVQNRIDIQGTVNAIKNNRIDGNLYFVSPNGMAVGSTGVINAGRFVALAPTQGYFDDLWSTSFTDNAAGNHDQNVDDKFKNDFAKFGTRYKKDEQEGKEEGEFKSTGLEFAEGDADKKGIEIKGQINTRSGIVLGAGKIAIENGAVLKSQKDINFSNLVNTENVSGADFTNVGMTVETDDKSGDIILRAEAKHDFANSPLIPVEQTYDSITNVNNHAAVTVKGAIEGDAGVDVSAASKTTFNNKDWPGISGLSDVVPELLNDLGITWAVDWAHKVNSAAVTLDSTGKVSAGGDASLQADSTLSIKIQAKTVGKRDAGATTAIPVTAVAVVNASNKALVDVKGDLAAEGDVSLAATADTTLDLTAKATTEKPDGDTGNAIYLGGALLFGDSVAEVNVDALTESGQAKKVTAGGAFSAEATANSEIAVEAASAGLDESFASTALAWLDYDSAANVNLKRSVEAESVTTKATNQVDSLGISADNSIGEGVDPMIEFKVAGESNVSALANKLKTKMGAEGFRQGGKLQGLENLFNNALQYVTAGAAVAVVDNTNTANVTIAPGVELKAVKKDEDGNPVAGGGDGTVEAVTNMKSFSHTVTGQLNKQTDNAAQNSKVNVAAAFLYSNIDNDATVELQSDNSSNNPKGVTLTSVSGNINLKADVDSDDSNSMSTLRGNGIVEAWDNLINALKAMDKDTSKLTQWKKETVEVQTQLEDGTISKAEAATKWTNALGGFGSFVSSEINDILKVDNNLKKMVTALSDYLSPSSYTNYYVRSYALNGNQSGNTTTVAASVNYANLENKGIVTIGEGSALTAGKDISIRSEAQTESISATGNSGEYLAYSETNGTGIGASLAWQDISADALVLAGKNVMMQARPADGSAAGKIDISTNAEVEDVSIIFSAGKADRSGLAGSFNVKDGGSNSLILVDDEATLSAADSVSLIANNKLIAFNVAGGLALGSAKSTATVGAGLAMNRQDVNSMTVIGDNGTNASTTITDTESEENKNKSIEEKNKIKKENTLAAARKLAADRGTIRSMDRNFADAKTAATRQLGAATASGADKGSVTGKSITASSVNNGTINALAVEGVSNSENHAGLDTVNQWNKTLTQAKSDITDTVQNVIGWPVARWANKTFTGETKKKWNFRKYEPIPENNDAANNKFNIAAAGSVSLNLNNSQTATVIDRVNLTLSDGGDGKLKNEATDDIFTGAWAGAAAMNWFTGGAGVASNNAAHKGTLGAAVALNKLDRNVKAVISNATVSQAKLIENTAIKKGTEAAASLGVAVTNNDQGTGTNAGIAFGLAMNKVNSGVHALLIDNTSTFTDSNNTSGSTGITDISNRAYDGDIQVAGGVDFAFANSADGGRAIAAGITAAVSEIENDIQSGIQGGTYTGVNNMSVAGEDALTQVNAAVGLGFTTSEHGFDGAASFAYAELENTNHAYISGTEEIKATGEVSVTDRDISGSSESNPYVKYLKDRKVDAIGSSYLSDETKQKLGTEAGSSIVNVAVEIAGSKSVALGAAIAAANVTNKFNSDITNNKKLEADSVKAAADVHTNIVSVAVGVSASTQSFGGTGSLAFYDLDQDNIVSVTGNRNGNTSGSGITANTVSGTANNTSHIVNVTGDFAGGKNAIGLGIAYNYMDDTTGIYFADNRIQAKETANGVGVSLDANNDAYALALSVGAAATYKDNGTVAAHGNFGINRGHNDTVAVIGEDKNGANETEKIINASSVTVKATDKTSKTTIAGSGELALNSPTVALGVGVALTESEKEATTGGDGRESVRAEINNADITTVKVGDKAPVISATSTDTSKATTVAVGIGLTNSSKFAAQGIGADANIYKNNTAGMKNTTIDANGGSKAALVNVTASTESTLKTGAAAMQLSGSNSFLAGVVAVGTNRIKDTTTAAVTYKDIQTSISQNVGNLDINATGKGDILSVAMGVSGVAKGTAAAGGSGSYNYIENNAAAKIEKANINSSGNVGVVAQSDEAISNYAGVLDVAVGGDGLSAAIGVTGSDNNISGKTEALIEDSTVVAAGSDSNKIKTQSKLKANTDDDKYLIDSAVSRNTWSSGSFTEGGGDNKKYGVSRLQKGREQEEKTGIVVDASATHSIASVMANGGVAAGSNATASVAGVVNLNYVSGETTAKVLDSDLNSDSIDSTPSDVSVRAADYTNVAEFSGSASVGIGQEAGIAAGFTGTTNEIDRATVAGISTKPVWNDTTKQYEINTNDKTKNNIFANNFTVTADAKQAMSAFNVTGAVAGSTFAAFETGDNVNTNRLKSSTIATVTNATVDYAKDAAVKASHEDAVYNLNVEAGITVTPDLFSAAGSLNIGIGVVNEESSVTANVENSDIKAHEKAENNTTKSNLTVGASNSSRLEATLTSVGVAAGVFSGSVASSIAVNNIDTKVTSRIAGSKLEADVIKVDTANKLKVKDAVGTGSGALLAGIGVGVEVNTLNDTVSTIVDNSQVTAKDTLDISTKTQREIESTVAGVGIGAAGIAVNVLAVTVNDGINQLGYSKDADGNNTSFSHTDAINKVLQKVNDNTGRDLSEYFFGMTDDEKEWMREKVKTSAKSGNVVSGTGVHTYVRNNSTLEATNGALTVNNTELNDAGLKGGSGSLGIAAINVADVVYHLNELNDISVSGSTVKGASVSLTTNQGNVTKGKNDAIYLQTVQAGLGIAGIGVGYAGLTTKGNTGITVEHGTISATNGDLTLKSTDDARSKADMVGVSAAGVAVPISVAHNTNIANNFVTVKGGSKLSATTTKTQTVTDAEGHSTTQKAPAYINLQTERTGRVAAKTVGVGVGGAAVVVNTAKVYDRSTSSVTVEEGSTASNSFTADAIRMEAVNAPVVKAEAGGTGVALVGVSVMQSNAEAYSVAKVDVKDGNKLLGDAVLAQAVIGKEETDMTHAETHGTNVSVGVGVNPNKAKAITETTASVSMGQETYKTEKKEKRKNDQGVEEEVTVQGAFTDLALITRNNASRRAILGNTTIGLVSSIGTGDAKAVSDDKSLITAKGGADSNGAVKLQNLKIAATGSNTAKGLADGDSGGATAFGASATITLKTKTTNTASLSGTWDVAENADIGSLQQVTSKGTSKTGAGGLLSVTWANSDNNVEMNTTTELKEGAELNAGQSFVLASNKVVTGAYAGETWNNHMNVGGVIQIAPDIKSRQEVTTNANVVIGKAGENSTATKVTTSKGQVYNAYSDLDIYNKVEGKGGGVSESIFTFSDAYVTSTNKVTVNEKAELEQKGEYENGNDITLGSSDKIKMDLAAEAYAGGLEGTVVAHVDAPVTRNNGVEVKGKLTSTHDINMYSGVNVDGTKSSLNVTALAEAHNNTVLPPGTSPAIDLKLNNNQQVKVGRTGSATSVRNINVSAENGNESIKKDTVAVYWLFLGQSKDSKTAGTKPGESKVEETNNNFVNVDGLLKTGIQNNVSIMITGHRTPTARDAEGQEVTFTPADNLNVAVTSVNNENKLIGEEEIVVGDMDYATQLGTQLAAIEKLIQDYSTGQSGDLVSYLGYLQQKQRILDEMESRGLFKEENGQKVYESAGYTISYVEIPEISVSGGNITVQSDTLYGNGRLEANGKPQVTITNESDAYLKVKGIRVGDDGGEIRFKGESVANNADITRLNKDNKAATFANLKNDTASGRTSAITIISENKVSNNNQIELQELDAQGNPAKDSEGNIKKVAYTAIPDIGITGDISNSHGDVIIENRSYHGNINIGSGTPGKGVTVNGKMVQMIASTGSVSQDYVDGIVNIGGRPEDLNSSVVNDKKDVAEAAMRLRGLTVDQSESVGGLSSTQSAPSAGRIAGDSIYIAAADINVNGLLQSGYSRYVADIGSDALAPEKIEQYKNNGSEVTVQGRTMYKVNDGRRAVYNASLDAYEYIVQVYYDPQTRGLVVEDIDAAGGKIYLTGRISSTGNGRVLAMDGGAEIAITNATSGDLTTGKILNNNIEGKVTITDLAKNTWTEYSRSAIKSMSIEDYTKSLKDPEAQVTITTTDIAENERYAANGGKKTTQYNVQNGQRYNWTLGTDTGTTTYYEKVTTSLFWGGVETGTDTNNLGSSETQANRTYQTPEGQNERTLGSGNFIGQITGNNIITSTDFGLVYENKHTSTSRTVTGNWKESGDWWALWSNPSYHTTWTTKNGSTQSYTFSLKADRSIDVGFIGKKDGSISVTNTNTVAGNVNLNGDIRNNTKDATLTVQSAGGSIIQKSGTSLTTGHADLKAKNNIENIHITSMGERIATGTQDAEGKEIYTTKDGVKLSAVSYNGGNIDVDVVGGSIDGQKLPGNVVITKLASKGQQDATGKPGDVSLKAEGNITQFISLGQKFTDENGADYVSAEAYLQNDATYQALPDNQKQAYANKVTQEFNQLADLRQKFTKTGSTETYDSAAEYLAQDNTYQGKLQAGSAYANQIKNEYANKDGNTDLEEKYRGYNSAEEYLAQDKAYQDLLYDSATYKDNVEDEFARFTKEETASVQGRGIRLTSVNGGIGTFEEIKNNDGTVQRVAPKRAVVINSVAEAYGLGEDTASVNAEAKKNIYLAEKDGDMRVGSIISHEGDVRVEATDGRLVDALPQQDNANNVDENDLIHHWIDAGLIAGTEDYEGAYIKGLKQDAANYKARVEAQYQEFKTGGQEQSLRQKFTKPGSSETYSSAAEYLEQDKTYMVMENSNADYKARIDYEFAHKDGNPDLEAKYANYTSAGDYLNHDTAYQNMLASSKNYKDKTEQDFAQFSVEEAIKDKFTKDKEHGIYYTSASEYLAEDADYQQLVKDTQVKTNPYVRQINQEFTDYKNGTASEAIAAKYAGYDSVSQFLLADTSEGGYLAMVKAQNDYEVAVCDEFAHFTNNKSKGQLSDMFTMPSGRTYESAADYLRDDATYNAMVQKYEQPEYAWTKDQLLYAIRNAIVNKESGVNAESQNKVANIQGKNVTLVARGIGVNTNQTTEINVSELGGGSEASIAKMKLLSNADAADVTMKNKNGDILRLVTTKSADGTLVNTWKAYKADDPSVEISYTDTSNYEIDKFVIGNLSPLGVYATGQLDVTAIDDNAFIAGRSNEQAGFAPVNVGQIAAVDNDVRLYTQEGIYDAAVTATGENQGNIHANNMIAYGGTKDIGAKDKPLTVNLSGALLEAYADGNVYIKNAKAGEKLSVGSVFAKDTVSLESAKGFAMTTHPDYTIAYLNAGKVLELKTSKTEGEIGTETNPIRILNNAGSPANYSEEAANNGMLINLEGKDAYVKGVNGVLGDNTTMRLGLIDIAGNFAATSESYMEAGAVRLAEGEEGTEDYVPGINGRILAAGDVKLDAVKDVTVNGPVYTAAGTIRVKSGANVTVNKVENDEDTLNADGVDDMNGGQIEIEAAGTATVNGSVAAKNVILVSGGKGVTLNDKVSAGSVSLDAETGEYTGNGLINLVSTAGPITQNDGGILTARRVTATSGKAITLANTGNTFREFMAEGVEKEITDDLGQITKEKAIDGSVDVRAHAGKTLFAGIDSTNVYGNVTLQNLDGYLGKNSEENDLGYGGLTVTTDIVAKQGNNGEAGSITFQQQGDILVQGALQADGYVIEEGYVETEQGITGSGSITNEKGIQAGKDVTIRTTSGDIHTLETVIAAGDVTAASTASADGKIQISGDVFAKNINLASLGATVTTEKNLDASQNVKVETLSGDIDLKGTTHAGKDIEISSGKNHSESGNITITGSVSATDNLTVQTEYEGEYANQGNIILGTLLDNNEQLIYAGDNVSLKTANGNIMANAILSAGIDLKATTTNGDISIQNNVAAQNDIIATSASGNIRVENGDIEAKRYITAQTGGEGNIHLNVAAGMTGRHVTAGEGISLTTDEGSIWVGGTVTAENGDVAAVQNNGKKSTGENGEEIMGGILFSGDVNAKNGNVTANVGNIGMIAYSGKVKAKGNIEATIAADGEGDIQYGDDYGNGMVEAGGNVTAETGSGSIVYASQVKAGQDITALTNNGNIKGSGSMNAGNDVTLGSAGGDIDLGADVTATNDATLWAYQGNVIVEGNVESVNGDTLLLATNGTPDESDGNVKVRGTIDSGGNTILEAENGDIMVNGSVTAGGDVQAVILHETAGNISLSGNVNAGSEVVARTNNGNIMLGSVSEDGSITDKTIYAELNIDVESASGDIELLGDVYAGRQISAVTGGDGTLSIGSVDPAGTVAEAGVQAGSSVYLRTADGDLNIYGKLEAEKYSVSLLSDGGDIYAMGDIDAGVDIIATSTGGKIELDGDVDAQNNIKVTNTSGKIELDGDIYAGNDLTVSNQTGAIEVKGDNASTGLIFAENNINITNTGGAIEIRGAIGAGQNVNAANTSGGIEMTGIIAAGQDVIVVNTSKDIKLTGIVNAGKDVNVTNGSGNVEFNGDVDAKQNIIINTGTGNITVNGDVTALQNDINVTSTSGNIELIGDIDAGHDVTARTGGEKGSILLNGFLDENNEAVWFGDQEKYNVHAGNDVSLTTENTGMLVTGKVIADNGDVRAVTETGAIIFLGNVSAGSDIEGKVVRDGIIWYDGTINAGKDVTATTAEGDIIYDQAVTAGGSVTALTDDGIIAYNAGIVAGDSILANTKEGGIYVGEDLTAGNNIAVEEGGPDPALKGTVTLTVGAGSVTVGNDAGAGNGNIVAYGNVKIDTQAGDATVKTSVTSRAGSVSISSKQGDIKVGEVALANGADAISAKENIDLYVADGVITVNGKTETTDGDISVHAIDEGEQNIVITQNGRLISGRDLTLHAYNGDIVVTDDTKAKRDLNVIVDNKGNIEFGKDVSVAGDVNIKTGAGNVTMGKRNDNGTTEVHTVTSTGGSIDIKTDKGNIDIGQNAASEPTIVADQNVKLTTQDGIITVDGKTMTAHGDITVTARDVDDPTGQNLVIAMNGELDAARNLTLQTYNGDIVITDRTKAGNDVYAKVEHIGDITFERDVSTQGALTFETGEGNITVGQDLKAGKDIKITSDKGIIDIGKTVESTGASVDIATREGNIHIGDNGPNVKTVTAKEDVSLVTENGKIEVFGKTSTTNGDITLKAANPKYKAGEDGQNIIIDHNGRIASGRDATLIAENGDLHVTDRVTAQRDLNAITQSRGDVFLDSSLSVNRNATLQAEKGDITVEKNLTTGNNTVLHTDSGDITVKGKVKANRNLTASTGKGDVSLAKGVKAGNNATVTSGKGNITAKTVKAGNNIKVTNGNGTTKAGSLTAGNNATVTTGKGNITAKTVKAGNNVKVTNGNGTTQAGSLTAGNRVTVANGDGKIVLGTADGTSVSLTNGGTNGHVTAKTIRTEANGNSKGTGKEDIRLGGSYVTANSIVNKSKGSTPLAISTLGSSKDKAMKDFNIGTRNADGSYAGGIQSGSGAVMQQLWTDNAMVYMAGKMNLHVSKAVVNNKLHAANDNISLAVFGRTPTHDGEQVVYWNDRNQNNPGALQNRWFNRAYADPKWMYLDLFGNGDIGSKYGVLVDANYHRRLYGDSVSVADTMRIRVERDDEVRDVVYYDRGGLIHVDANVLPADEENGGITAD